MIKEILLRVHSSNANETKYKVLIDVDKFFDSKKHFLSVEINSRKYEVGYDSTFKTYATKKDCITVNKQDNEELEVKVKALVYNIVNLKILEAKTKSYKENKQNHNLDITEAIKNTVIISMATAIQEKRIVKVEGPYDSNGKLVAEIVKGEVYTYRALPNQKLNEADLSEIKFAYKYDNGDIQQFLHSNYFIDNNMQLMQCIFPHDKEYSSVTVYAYFKKPLANISAKANVKKATNQPKAVMPKQNPSTPKIEPVVTEPKVVVPEEVTPEKSEPEVSMAKPKEKQTNEKNNCKCTGTNLIWGGKVSCEFQEKVILICEELWGTQNKLKMANGLMAVMACETAETFTTSYYKRENRKLVPLSKEDVEKIGENFNKAVGLIQFIGSTISEINKNFKLKLTKGKLANMSQLEQLEIVKKYFMLYNAYKKVKTPEDIYLLVFAPIGVGKEDNYVLYDKSTRRKDYDSNRSVDWENNRNGKIERFEILNRYYKWYKDGEKETGCNKEKKAKIDNSIKPKQTPSKEPKKPNVNPIITGKFDAESIMTYHIFDTGNIEKHIPKKITDKNKLKYKFVYHDASNNTHDLGVFNYKLVEKRKVGNKIVSGKVELIDVREFKSYNSNGLKVGFMKINSSSGRYFINPSTFAGLVGAMAKLNIDFLCFNGFSDSVGKSVGGSKSHYNGWRGDIRYLSKNKNAEPTLLQDSHFDYNLQVKFNNELFNFGWSSDGQSFMLTENFRYQRKTIILPHCHHLSDPRHNNHLHLQGFDFNKVKTIYEK